MTSVDDSSDENTTASEEKVPFDEDIFIVEKIVDKGKSRDGIALYRVRWEGYRPHEDTWEPIGNLENCLNLVEKFEQERSTKRRKRHKKGAHGTYTIGPPPPLRDDFWQRADEGTLEIEKETIYEKVKKRKRSSLENDSSSSNNLLKHADVFAVDSDDNSDDATEKTTSPPISPLKRESKSHKRRKGLEEFSKLEKIGDTVTSLRNNVEKPNESSTADDVSSNKISQTHECIRRKSEKSVRFADEKDEKSKKDKIKSHDVVTNKNAERLASKKVNSDSSKPIKKIFDCPINFAINSEKTTHIPLNQQPKMKKVTKKLSLTTPKPPTPPPLDENRTQEIVQPTTIDCDSTSNSPGVVDIGLDSNGNGSLENIAPVQFSPDSASVQKIEVLEKSFNEACDRLDKNGSQLKSFRRLKRLYEDVQRQIERMKSFCQPITYIPSDEEKARNWQKLYSAIIVHDLVSVERMLMEYRAFELGLDDVTGGKSLLMICSTLKCKQDDHALCKIIRLLVQCGADPNKSLPNGETALMLAAKMGHCCKIKRLLNLGAKIDSVNDLGETALFYAIRKCPEKSARETVKMLLRFGIDYSLENNNNATAVRIAEYLKKPHLITAITEYVSKFESDFANYQQKVTNNSIEITEKMLNLRSLQVKTNGNWTFNFNVKELLLPEGFGVCLFICLAKFDENGVKFFSNENIPVSDVLLNDNVLSSLTNGSMDVLWLEPIQYGINRLIVCMTECKHNLDKIVVQANIIRVTDTLDDSNSCIERQG